jgi:site-specific DNA-methyltransferase (adenine-specific)
MLTITNEDNMELMARYPDKYFDLAIVDPPYGIGMDGGKKYKRGKDGVCKQKEYKPFGDEEAPDKSYFNELIRVSKNQIVWFTIVPILFDRMFYILACGLSF